VNRILCLFFAAFCCIATGPEASACAACFGKSDSPLAYGMNAGIYVLLAVIGSMLGLITSFFVFVSRRAARMAATEPDSTDATV